MTSLHTRSIHSGVKALIDNRLAPAIGLAAALLLAGCQSPATSEAPGQQFTVQHGDHTAQYRVETLPAATYLTREYQLERDAIEERTPQLAQEVAVAAVKKAKVDLNGPLTLFLPDFRTTGEETLPVRIGFPIQGFGNAPAPYRIQRESATQALTLDFDKNTLAADQAWRNLYSVATQKGLEPSGDNRTVVRQVDDGYRTELQLGLK